MTPRDAFAAGRLAEAIDLQEGILSADPQDASARLGLIELLLFTGQLDEARSHLAIIESEDPNWPDAARMFRRLVKAEHRRSHRIRRPIIIPEPIPEHAKARWMAVRCLREGDSARAVKWVDRADERSPTIRGFLDGVEFASLRDADDRFASVLEAFVDGEYVWIPLEALSRVRLEPGRFVLDQFVRSASVRLKDGLELAVQLPLIYPGSHEADGEFAVGLETDEVCPDDGPIRCVGAKLLIVDDEEMPLDEVTMLEVK